MARPPRGRTRSTRRRELRSTRPTPPGAALGIAVLVVSGYAWWLQLHADPTDDLGLPYGLQVGTFGVAAVVASTWRMLVGPATGARGSASRRTKRGSGKEGKDGRDGRTPFPPRGLWLLPVVELVLFAPTLPVLSANNPDDPTVAGLLFVFTLVLGWIAVLFALVAFLLLVLPALVVLRPVVFVLLRKPLGTENLLPSVLCLAWLAFVFAIGGGVLGKDAPGNRGGWEQTAVLFGVGEPDSPGWVWFGRGCLAVLALCALTVVVVVSRAPRSPRVVDARAPAPPAPAD